MALEVLAGYRIGTGKDGLALCQYRQKAFRHGKVQLHGVHIIQSGNSSAGADQRARAHLTKAQHAVKGRADETVVKLGLGFRYIGLGNINSALQSIQLGGRHGFFAYQLAYAAVLAQLLFQVNLGCIQFCLFFLVV